MSKLKTVLKTLMLVLLGSLVSVAVFYGAVNHLSQLPAAEQIQDFDNVSTGLPIEHQRVVKRSRNSTVRILSVSTEGGVATTTGTYIKAKGKYYIITVMHGLVGPCDVTRVWTEEEGFTQCQRVVLGNALVDYAIIEVAEIPSLEAVPIPRALPSAPEWEQTLAAQSDLYYTGYPNSTGPLTFSGRLVGYADGDYIYMHSFAWGGASGSGVFGANGEFVGYILAIDIGETSYGIDVLEDIVIVVPAFKIDWATILK
jgi:hypothetical protein